MKLRRCIGTVFILAVLATVAEQAGQAATPSKLPEPFFHGDELKMAYFGDATNVRLLAGLLNDPDPLVREQAVQALGETHNILAMRHIRAAMQDEAMAVRCAAVAAAAEFPQDVSAHLVSQALADDDHRVVLAAMCSVRRMRLKSAAARIKSLLSAPDSKVTTFALATLTDLGVAVRADKLKPLLRSNLLSVRIQAVRNALPLTGTGGLTAELTRLAKSDEPPVRSEAIAALGKFAFRPSARIITQAAKDANPLLRRAAVLAYRHAGKADMIPPFLKDASGAVRFAAIRAAGELKCADPNCVSSLFDILLKEPTDTKIKMFASDRIASHRVDFAVSNSLSRIGSKQVEILAAEALSRQTGNINTWDKPARNILMCSRILGQLKSLEGFDTQLELLGKLKLDSPATPYVAEALGLIGDQRAVPALTKKLEYCRTQAFKWLKEQQKMTPSYVEHSPRTTVSIIHALARLRRVETAKTIQTIATMGIGSTRLQFEAAGAAEVLTEFVTPDNRAEIEETITTVLFDDKYSLLAYFKMAKAAAKLKVKKALPPLRIILNEDRPERRLMHAAAWAIQEISGKTPRIPDPKVRQNNTWILKKIKP